MKNAWLLFVGDMRRLRINVMTVITVVGLVALPSIFSWYNILACWNVFDNTGNLTIAVANEDEGYKSDLVPIRVNIGDQVTKALRENDQLNWVFTDADDAIDGTRSGRYYAAVVIPETFSRDMMSFYSNNIEHASIVYYSNQKKNAIAPKMTDQGADQVSRQINQTFVETLSEVALGIATALLQYGDDADIEGFADTAGAHLSRVGAEMSDAGEALALYADILTPAHAMVEDAGTLLSDAKESAEKTTGSAADAHDAASAVPDAIDEAADALSIALAECVQSYRALPSAIASLLDTLDATSADTAAQLRTSATDVEALAADCRALSNQLERAQTTLGDANGVIAATITRLNSSATLQEQLSANLTAAATSIEATNTIAQEDRDELTAIAAEVKASLDEARADYDKNLAPLLADLSDIMDNLSTTLAATSTRLSDASNELVGATGSLAGRIDAARTQLAAVSAELERMGGEIADLGARVAEVAISGDIGALREIVGTDPETLASAISAPIKIERNAVFPVDNFGSAMSPLYTTLALWIGALLIMVTLKVVPSGRTVAELDRPTKRQLFIGRFGVIAVISLMQSTAIALGNLFFLGVQAVHPWLYLLCFWLAGLTFAFIIYTLVVLLANLGKALSVILLIVQVSGGGGSFPMQLLPDFFQSVGPYLPITHAVKAMRAAMFGLYNGDFWIEVGTLALFAVPFVVFGIVLIGPLSRIVPKFVEHVEASKLM